MRHSQRPVTRSRDAQQVRHCRHPSACSTPAGAVLDSCGLCRTPAAVRVWDVGAVEFTSTCTEGGRAGGQQTGSVSKH